MRILILGGDGYLGWPTTMHFASAGHEVLTVDNHLHRTIAAETSSEPLIETPYLDEKCRVFNGLYNKNIKYKIVDLAITENVEKLFKEFQPEVIIHYAEQPSAPYSMMGLKESRLTLNNNLNVTFNCLWAMKEHCPDSHLIKLGTMGEYGTPNIDIEEGWINIHHNGREEKFLYPRAAGSLYHTTKVLDTDLIWFYVRTFGLKVTDLMQGPVYGINTLDEQVDPRILPYFHYDDIFGTVLNRFIVQAVANIPLTVYGTGSQTRGYLNILDTLQCVQLASETNLDSGELSIMNQFTETFSVNELANKITKVARQMGLDCNINHIGNPRKEKENHYYNPKSSKLLNLGLKPNYLTDAVISKMIEFVQNHSTKIMVNKILPRVMWNK